MEDSPRVAENPLLERPWYVDGLEMEVCRVLVCSSLIRYFAPCSFDCDSKIGTLRMSLSRSVVFKVLARQPI